MAGAGRHLPRRHRGAAGAPPDLIAAGFLALLGVVVVATILFLGIVEDAASYAALQAVGWRGASLGSALVTQAVVIGLVGGLAVARSVSAWSSGWSET